MTTKKKPQPGQRKVDMTEIDLLRIRNEQFVLGYVIGLVIGGSVIAMCFLFAGSI